MPLGWSGKADACQVVQSLTTASFPGHPVKLASPHDRASTALAWSSDIGS